MKHINEVSVVKADTNCDDATYLADPLGCAKGQLTVMIGDSVLGAYALDKIDPG
jgi:hypothetical protein